ncbi:MAG: 2-oxoacid:acceptor oxidoreductase family protein [Candidatus Dojkabacteria bacterium]|nr:MAG: 2-oxoacid:acceptor oxidoreductase family protein [Candidatus Dojkabacteria bacterium]
MSKYRRTVVKVGGESGQGINSVGEILSDALKGVGYKVFAYREYPSLIKGGVAAFQIEWSDLPISSPSAKCDLLVCISRATIYEYLQTLNSDGLLIHSLPKVHFNKEEEKFIQENSIKVHYVKADELALLEGGNKIMANVVLIGLIWKLIGESYESIEGSVLEVFGKKEQFIEGNKKSLAAGYNYEDAEMKMSVDGYAKDAAWAESYVLTGSHAFSLGTLSAGMKAYYSYPMTPSSPVLSYLAEVANKKDLIVKQVEDEISAVQMAIGSMFMGARAMTGTSGGGFDLMTETISNAGIAEIPLVILLAQRHGAATGLPTWTGSSDSEPGSVCWPRRISPLCCGR